jgi:hypothetical protein
LCSWPPRPARLTLPPRGPHPPGDDRRQRGPRRGDLCEGFRRRHLRRLDRHRQPVVPFAAGDPVHVGGARTRRQGADPSARRVHRDRPHQGNRRSTARSSPGTWTRTTTSWRRPSSPSSLKTATKRLAPRSVPRGVRGEEDRQDPDLDRRSRRCEGRARHEGGAEARLAQLRAGLGAQRGLERPGRKPTGRASRTVSRSTAIWTCW